jgi:hypothetical protein
VNRTTAHFSVPASSLVAASAEMPRHGGTNRGRGSWPRPRQSYRPLHPAVYSNQMPTCFPSESLPMTVAVPVAVPLLVPVPDPQVKPL